MGYSFREFETRIKAICPRWYLKGGNLLLLSGKGLIQNIFRPIQVWEKPYAYGPGFQGDSLVMEIGDIGEYQRSGFWETPNPKHVKELKRGHWIRVRAKQLEFINKLNEENRYRTERIKKDTLDESRAFAHENREVFRQASKRLGLSRLSLSFTHGKPELRFYKPGE